MRDREKIYAREAHQVASEARNGKLFAYPVLVCTTGAIYAPWIAVGLTDTIDGTRTPVSTVVRFSRAREEWIYSLHPRSNQRTMPHPESF